MIPDYKGRIIKFGVESPLVKRHYGGIDEAIATRKNLKHPITRDECIDYLQFRESIMCLDICKSGYAYELIKIKGRHYALDTDRESYISYNDLCKIMPSNIRIEDYGSEVLRYALRIDSIDRALGTHSIILYCPSSMVAKHFLLSGCRTSYHDAFLDLIVIMEKIRKAVHDNKNDYLEDSQMVLSQGDDIYYFLD